MLQDMGLLESQHVTLGIVGVSDFETDNATFEIKCPFTAGYNNQVGLLREFCSCLPVTLRTVGFARAVDAAAADVPLPEHGLTEGERFLRELFHSLYAKGGMGAEAAAIR